MRNDDVYVCTIGQQQVLQVEHRGGHISTICIYIHESRVLNVYPCERGSADTRQHPALLFTERKQAINITRWRLPSPTFIRLITNMATSSSEITPSATLISSCPRITEGCVQYGNPGNMTTMKRRSRRGRRRRRTHNTRLMS